VAGVIIGIDPHKGSHTAVTLDEHENKLGQLRVRATPAQVEQLRRWAAAWPNRTWAIEGARGLYISFRWVTQNLTTAQKELFADSIDAVRRRRDVADGLAADAAQVVLVTRWWRED
jgi:hypothetical protein